MRVQLFIISSIPLLLIACSTPVVHDRVPGHLNPASTTQIIPGNIPSPVLNNLPPPVNSAAQTNKAETYSVVVNNIQARDLLFALARDAKINVDIHPGISGTLSLNAIDQTLPQLLQRIARQVDIRFEFDGDNISVMPDSPFLRHYTVDYVNMARNVSGTISTNTQISTAGNMPGAATGGSAGNISNTRIDNSAKNIFWESLEKNIKDILRETDKTLPEGSSETVIEQTDSRNSTGPQPQPPNNPRTHRPAANTVQQTSPVPSSSQTAANSTIRRNTFREAAAVILNAESGVITVRATQRQHEKIQEFIDRVVHAARRQVMIETTIVEVELSDGFKQGIDWNRFRADDSGFSITRPANGSVADSANTAFSLILRQLNKPLNLVAAVNLLESFGTTKVLSSPRLSVLNNQTALLKVVESIVYFNVKSDTTTSANVGTTTAVTTTPQSVSVGLVMAVTPQISESGTVIINIRPTISSVSDWKEDPNPSNKAAGVQNLVPQIRTREVESVMRVTSGDIAVLGGLMEDGISYNTGRIPLLGQIPLAGELLTKRDNSSRKSELVIFLRPVVIKEASLEGDYRSLKDRLPGPGMFSPGFSAHSITGLPEASRHP